MKITPYKKQKTWSKEQEALVEQFVEIFRESIIANCEYCADQDKTDTISNIHTQFGMFRAIATIHMTNKLSLLEKRGPDVASVIIAGIEQDAAQSSLNAFKEAQRMIKEMFKDQQNGGKHEF